MAGGRLTKRVIDGLKPAAVDRTIWDGDLTGFGVRVRPSGAMTFIIRYRPGGGRDAPIRRITLGAVGAITVDEARRLAREHLAKVRLGFDPIAEKRERREALTLDVLADLWMAEHVEAKRKAATADQYRHMLDRYIRPALGSRRAAEITRADVAKLHSGLKAKKHTANRCLAVISSMYVYGGKRGLLGEDVNPARKVEAFKEAGRERYLSGEDLELPIIGNPLCHAQPATTARYAHLDPDPLKRARDVIAGTIAAAMGEALTPKADVVADEEGTGMIDEGSKPKRPGDTRREPTIFLTDTEATLASLKDFCENVSALFDPETRNGADNKPLTDRDRYVFALIALVRLFERIGMEYRSKKAVAELASALFELRDGVQADFLKPDKAENRPRDPSVEWRVRARLCIAFEMLRLAGMTVEKAAKHIERRHPRYKFLATGRNGLARAILAWHGKFERGELKDPIAQEVYRYEKNQLERVLARTEPPRWKEFADALLSVEYLFPLFNPPS